MAEKSSVISVFISVDRFVSSNTNSNAFVPMLKLRALNVILIIAVAKRFFFHIIIPVVEL